MVYPSQHLLVFKTSSRHVLKTFSVRLQRNSFSSSKMSWRRLEYILQGALKTSWRSLKTSWKTKNCYDEDILRTSWRPVLKMSSRPLVDTQNDHWVYLYLANLNMYLKNICFTNLYLTNLSWIRNASIRAQSFRPFTYFETKAVSLF